MEINAITVEDGTVDQYVALFADITDLKKSDLALRRAQKMEAIGQLTSGISHDFNNLLGVILGNLDLIEDKTSVDDLQRKYLTGIKHAGGRAVKLVNQLLNFSRKKQDETAVVVINQRIKMLSGLVWRSITPEIDVSYHLADDLWAAKIDPNDFEDSLLNLVINARDAIEGNGNITIETNNITFDETFYGLNSNIVEGEYVQLSISDSGSGIATEQLVHIFEPFFTTKEKGKGTGLGLSMVYGFANRSSGYVEAESTEGKGATFTLYFPRSMEKAQSLSVDEPLEVVSRLGGSCTVLVVDDEPALLALAEEYLLTKGYRVLLAANGKEALAILEQEADIDLLFTDVIMPGGINGYELKKRALELNPSLKVLLTSGYTGKAAEANGVNSLDLELLRKPYSFAELMIRVGEVLEGR